jgi:arginine/serine-rich splicing factor 16
MSCICCLVQTLRFESYRDLVRLAARGFNEAQGLATVDSESLDRRAAQHAAMQAATDAVYFNPKPGAAGGPGTAAHGAAPAGTGMYSAMGFSYDSSAGGPAGAAANPAAAAAADASDSSSDDDSDEDSEDDDESALAGAGAAGLAGPVSEAELAQEAEDERVDDMAESYGLADFSYRLHRALEKEGEEEARMRKRPK